MASWKMGPGAMVAAAFIGPGTVTTATAAGAGFGLSLLWAVVFSVLATLILQELAVRCALVSERDLSPLLRDFGLRRWWGKPLLGLIVLAIGVGNSAYQSGNLVGAALGLQSATGGSIAGWVLLAAGVAGALIWMDRYQLIERVLVFLVVLMATLFLGIAALVAPQLADMDTARLVPALPVADLSVILALIGTTVVPYNLFLHASAVRKRWAGQPLAQALAEARRESLMSIVFGGVITAAVVVVAAVLLVPGQSENAIAALVTSVESLLPGWGGTVVGLGLFAAGLTSAIAAPVSAGWAVCGAMGWSLAHRSAPFRLVAFAVLATGVLFAIVATRPVALIVLAQATNALLLPIIAGALLVVANQRSLLGDFRNSVLANGLAGGVLLLVMALAASKLAAVLMG